MQKVNILAVAPYKGLKDLLENTAMTRDDIDLTVYLGDLKAGAELVLTIDNIEKYDVIISRGGTAEMIQDLVQIPVIEIKLTEYDMMRAINLAQNYSGKFAIVGFPNITRYANMICDLLQYKIDTYTIKSGDEAERVIEELAHLDYSLIVGDAVTISKASKYHLNGLLITSGKESINEAFDEAQKLVKAVSLSSKKNTLYQNILNNCFLEIVAFNKDKEVVYSNLSNQSELETIKEKLIQYIPQTLKEKTIKLMLKLEGYQWTIEGNVIMDGYAENIIYYIKKIPDISTTNNTFYEITNVSEKEDLSSINFYLSTRSTRYIIDRVSKIVDSQSPILIYGENGTDKDSIAYHIHSISSHKNNPMLTINCKNITDKELSFILYNENSPITENNLTVYFKNVHHLNGDKQEKLINYIDDSFLTKRSLVIYSTEKSIEDMQPGILPEYILGSEQYTYSIAIPPLRELSEEIPSLTSIYISMLNLELGKQVSGVSPGAMELLKNFSWDFNFNQFINVLKKLILITETNLIQEEDTITILEEEVRIHSQTRTEDIQFKGTLDEITSSIIYKVLEEEDMNQSKAAKRLGISRSTLWRKLKSEMV
ncbi:sigma-54-dependent Fis family transcriptional regulator [Salinibacillus xinjiangensis]|uniref:Sigma-54 factor interaction domain-containing protein n=1 Tax=Salinibacillus xinjiangensis TaxID=1229268 RepID=A0A6G1X256_9BACI|nr:sigma-54-dependent transcriptional regulator [Salinibacillus xinjiangensis]MRG85019.1 hypothetical protein [Salinibacillus xinjiangensis]